MKDIEEIQQMSIGEKKEYLKYLKKTYADCLTGRGLCTLSSVMIAIVSFALTIATGDFSIYDILLFTAFTTSFPAVGAVLLETSTRKYAKKCNKLDEIIKKEELESYEDKKSKEKIKEIEVENSINYNIKQCEIEKKILSISEKELDLEKKKELLNLYKDNIEKFNELYETYELLDYLEEKGYSSSEVEYLIGEIEETRTTEKAYQMKLNRGTNDR